MKILIKNKITVLYERMFDLMPHRIKIYLQTFLPDEFYRRNEIGIPSNKNNLIDNSFGGH